MKLFAPSRLALEDRLEVDAALEEAFAPLRTRRANISPARVRAAVRWAPEQPQPFRGLALITRIAEVSVAAVVSAFLFGGSIAWVSPVPDVSRDPAAAGEWMLNGRTALQRPMASRATDYRTIAGDIAANAVTIRREATRTERVAEQTAANE
jgi:hypothetical protein